MPVVINNHNVNSLAIVIQIQDEDDIPYYEIDIYPRNDGALKEIKEPYTIIPPNKSARMDSLEV